MRLLIVGLILLLTTQLGYGQYVDKSQEQYQDAKVLRQKLAAYNKMKRVGNVFLISGGALTATGIVLLANAYARPSGDLPYGVIGAGAIGIGVPFLTSGTILTIIGAKKSSEYSKRLANVSVSYNQLSSSPTLLFTFDF